MAIIKRNNEQNQNLTNFSPFSNWMDDFVRFPAMWEDFVGNSLTQGLESDMWEEEDTIFIKVPLAGISPDEVEISTTDDSITIKAEHKQEAEGKDKKKNFYHKQIRHGRIMQSFVLPTRVNSDKAEANFENGMLTIRLPKSEESKPKKISINTNK